MLRRHLQWFPISRPFPILIYSCPCQTQIWSFVSSISKPFVSSSDCEVNPDSFADYPDSSPSGFNCAFCLISYHFLVIYLKNSSHCFLNHKCSAYWCNRQLWHYLCLYHNCPFSLFSFLSFLHGEFFHILHIPNMITVRWNLSWIPKSVLPDPSSCLYTLHKLIFLCGCCITIMSSISLSIAEGSSSNQELSCQTHCFAPFSIHGGTQIILLSQWKPVALSKCIFTTTDVTFFSN